MRTFVLLGLVVIMSCKPEDAVPTTPVMNPVMDQKDAMLVKQASIMGVNHAVSGTASLYINGNNYSVVLDPFSSQNGPDLKVYLSKDVGASEYVRLGDLQSTTGRQTYAIPLAVDVSTFNYVHIWCEKFSVEFARAELK